MSRFHRRQVHLVKNLLTKPRWYNETLVHPNWPLIKREIRKYERRDLLAPRPAEYDGEIDLRTSLMRNCYHPVVIRPNHPVGVTT